MASKSFTKSEMAALLANRFGFTKSNASGIVDYVFDTLCAKIEGGERIELRGFGVFAVKNTPSRIGRNPQTGDPVDIPAGRKVTFKPSKTLLER